MNKMLVCYFSASGVTKGIAIKIKNTLNTDIFEIEPVKKYTNEDLDWTDKNSRSTIEMNDKSFRPEIKNKTVNLEDYNTILIGFPIWWDTAPTIINTFIEKNNLKNKNIYLFATSGSSTIDNTLNDLRNRYLELNFISGKRFNGSESIEEIRKFINI